MVGQFNNSNTKLSLAWVVGVFGGWVGWWVGVWVGGLRVFGKSLGE